MGTFDWRSSEKFANEIFDLRSALDNAVAWVADNLSPEDVFDQKVLDQWAYDNGFKKFE